jgi:hypothetical protein
MMVDLGYRTNRHLLDRYDGDCGLPFDDLRHCNQLCTFTKKKRASDLLHVLIVPLLSPQFPWRD